MRDVSAKELKGHNILAVERFHDDTRWMIEFVDAETGEEMRLFLTDPQYQEALERQDKRQIKIRRYAHVTEGHIIDFRPKGKGKKRRR